MNTLDGFKLLLATVTVGLTSGRACDPHQFFGGAAPLLRTLNIGVAHASTMLAPGTTTTPPFASQLSLGSSALDPIRAVKSSVLGHLHYTARVSSSGRTSRRASLHLVPMPMTQFPRVTCHDLRQVQACHPLPDGGGSDRTLSCKL